MEETLQKYDSQKGANLINPIKILEHLVIPHPPHSNMKVVELIDHEKKYGTGQIATTTFSCQHSTFVQLY